MRVFTQCGIGLLFLLLSSLSPVFADSTFLKFGSAWKYLDDGSTPALAWKEGPAFNDDSWPSGISAFGYGSGYLRTQVKRGNPNYTDITTYFRKSVNISRLSSFDLFRFNLYVDNGAVIYINGKEVNRSHMPQGTIQNGTQATSSNVDNANILTSATIGTAAFKEGINDIAVEVHQNNRQSRSMIFDLEMIGVSGKNPPQIVRGPLMQVLTTDGVTIKWKTNLPSTSAIRFGIAENMLTGSVSDNALVTDHELTIKGLTPDTRYFYAIGTADYVMKGSYRNTFSTAPPANSTRKIRIAVIGDAGTGDFNQKRSRDRYLETIAKGENPDLTLMLGDNAYPLGTDKDYQGGFFNIYNDNIFDNHPVFPVPGNHEYAGVAHISDIAYYNIFTLPKAGESGGVPSGTESYYSFNYGNVHFVMLNSYGIDGGKVLYDTTGQQATWLKNDLAANAGKFKWTIACFHHAPYTNANHSSDQEGDLKAVRERITPILERFNVDLVLAGHSHSYERSYLVKNHTGNSASFNNARPPVGNMVDSSSARYDGTKNSCPYILMDSTRPNGTVYVVAGAAGQLGGGANAKFPLFYYRNYAATEAAECGLFTLEIEDNRIDGKFIGATTGTVMDHFTMMKGAGKRNVLAAEVNKVVKLNASWTGNYNWSDAGSSIKNESRSLSVKSSDAGTSTYYVRDNANEALSCITDTFVIRSYAAVMNTNIQFTVTQNQNQVFLKWSTEQEINTGSFTIERSANGVDYTQIGMVPGVDLSVIARDYNFEDKAPQNGKNYYRLLRLAKTGQRAELGVRMINFLALYSVKVTPRINPSPSG
ncbi:MAG: metallophosphoesterase family protein, partial [Chitinophagaceae bacterium]